MNGMNSFPFFTFRSVFFFGSAIIVIRLGIRFFFGVFRSNWIRVCIASNIETPSLVGEDGIRRTFCVDERTSPVAAVDAAIRNKLCDTKTTYLKNRH